MAIDVLLVEDNPGDALLVSDALTHAGTPGFAIRQRTTLASALQAIDKAVPAVVLLDLSLPDSRGLDTLTRLRDSWPSVPIIVLTGLDDDEVGVLALQQGAQDYINKDEASGRRLARAIRFAIERTTATRDVQQWRERYTLWIQQAADGLWDWSLGDAKVIYSPGWKSALGFAPDEIGDTIDEWFERVVARDASRLANELQRAIGSDDATFAVEYRIRNKQGYIRWMRARGMIVRDRVGQAVRVAGSQTDVTDQQENPCSLCGHENPRGIDGCEHCGQTLRDDTTTETEPDGRISHEVVAGTLLAGQYRITSLISVGGAGAVYVARDERRARRVAVKILHPWLLQTPETRERFTHEAQAQTSIVHPNVVQVFDVVSTDGRDFIVMEYVAGPTLREFAFSATSPASAADVVRLFDPVIDGIATAHAAGIVHRDIKPENILVASTDAGFVLKVSDFGVAKLPGAARRTKTGVMLGTLQYMAPEQFVDARDADERADIYALACTLYELLTRRPPFVEESDFALMTAHMTQEPPHPREFNPLVPPALGDVLLVALAKDPAARYQDCDAFRRALKDAVS